jgi:hypothetical protein
MPFFYYDPERELERPAVEEAVRHIGSNAIPLLLKWIRYEVPTARSGLYGSISKLPGGNNGHGKLVHSLMSRSEKLALAAEAGFEILGPGASAAIPELVRMMNETNSPDTAIRAVNGLFRIGDNALPALISGLDSQSANIRVGVVLVIGNFCASTNSEHAAIALAVRLGDKDSRVAGIVGVTLQRFKPEVLILATNALRKLPKEQ